MQGKSPATKPNDSNKVAYVFHALLAAFLCLALAMQIHLWAIDATGEVVGAGIFLVIVYLGLPAIIIAILAFYYSLKASDTRITWLLISMILIIMAIVFKAPALLLGLLQAGYIMLVIVVGLLSRLKRMNEA